MDKYPHQQWYWGDWFKDPAVAMCSPATRGVWIDLLGSMHELGRTGKLQGTIDQLARMARCTLPEIESALSELKTNKVADVSRNRTSVVTLANRRMSREYRERENAAKRQRNKRKRDRAEPEPDEVSRQNNGVTSTSTSMSMSNTRASDVDVGVDAHVDFDLDEDRLDKARRRFERAHRIVRASKVPEQRRKDFEFLAKVCILSATVFSENWLVDSCEAVRIKGSRKNPFAHLTGILRDKAKANGKTLNSELHRVSVPDEFYDGVSIGE